MSTKIVQKDPKNEFHVQFVFFGRVAGLRLRLEHDFDCGNMRVSLGVPFVLVVL